MIDFRCKECKKYIELETCTPNIVLVTPCGCGTHLDETAELEDEVSDLTEKVDDLEEKLSDIGKTVSNSKQSVKE